MNGKTHKIRRRFSVVALAASIAVVAAPAATAGGGVGADTVQSAAQEHGAAGFGSQTLNLQDLFRSAAQEHGAAGFGNGS